MTSNSLSGRAMLANLTIGIPSGRKIDKNASADTCAANQASNDAGRFWKDILPKECLADIKRLAGEARTYHYKRTVPWLDNGPRLLSAMAYTDYSDAMRQFKETFLDSYKPAFLASLPNWLDLARRKLGNLYNPGDYPSSDSLEKAFEFTVRVFPVPDSDDFRVSLSEAQTNQIRRDIEEAHNQAINAAMADVWNRIGEHCRAMTDKLKAYNPEGGKQGGVFRDSLVGNMRELVDLLPSLNVTGDSSLNVMANRMRNELCAIDATELRMDESARKRVAESADSILNDVSVFMA